MKRLSLKQQKLLIVSPIELLVSSGVMLKKFLIAIFPTCLVLYSSIILIYGNLSNVVTNPNLIYTAINYNYPDSLSFIWNFWWYNFAIENLQNPFYSNLLFHPFGANLLLHTSTPLLSLFFTLFLYGINPVLKYNLALILIYLLNFICGYYCFNLLSKDKLKAIYLASLLATSPYIFSHAVAGHLNLIAIFQVQLVFLFFFKLKIENNKKNIICFSLALFALPFLSLNYFYFFLLFSFFYFIFNYHEIKFYFKPYFLSFIFLTPYLYLILKSFSSSNFTSNHNPEVHSADLLSFFFFNKYQLLSGFNFLSDTSALPEVTESSLYLGYSLILMFILSLKNALKNREVILYTAISLFFLILSLGPKIKVGGEVALNYSLYNIFEILPAFPSVPARFYIFSFIFLLFVISISKISRKTVVILSLICLVEYFPIYTKFFFEFKDKSVLYQIKDDNKVKAIIDATDNEYASMLRQTIHKKKITRAFIARKQKKVLNKYKHNHFLRMLEAKKYNEKKLESDYKKLKVDGVLVSKSDNSKNFIRQNFSKKYANDYYEFYSD